jgi:hypothetical protein
VPFPFFFAGSAERHALIEQHIIADNRSLADYDSHAVINEEAPSDSSTRVNFDSREQPIHLRNSARQQDKARGMHPVSQPMQQNSVEAWITEENFNHALGCGIVSKDGIDLFPDCSKHTAYN